MKRGRSRPRSRKHRITFSLEAAGAKEVYLVGEFNNWKVGVHPMEKGGNGTWNKELLLPEGKFEYKFFVDNRWMADPDNLRVCTNCFGTRNSIVRVVPCFP